MNECDFCITCISWYNSNVEMKIYSHLKEGKFILKQICSKSMLKWALSFLIQPKSCIWAVLLLWLSSCLQQLPLEPTGKDLLYLWVRKDKILKVCIRKVTLALPIELKIKHQLSRIHQWDLCFKMSAWWPRGKKKQLKIIYYREIVSLNPV
jgi:hypothetical protein